MKTSLVAMIALWLLSGSLTMARMAAADPPVDDHSTRTATDKAATDQDNADLEARLEAARARLEEAAHEVAELSAQTGRSMMDHMRAFDGETPPRAVIGVQLDPASGKEGARIQEVSPGGAAAQAGIKSGDTIVALNGTDVKGEHTARQVMQLMHEVQPDSKVKLRVIRDGKPLDFVVTPRPGMGYFALHGHPPLPPHPPEFFGEDFMSSLPFMIHGPLGHMELATLTPRLGHYFGTEKGVLVVRAPQEGGLKLEDGDVILAIDGREPSSGSHATRILSSYQPGEKVTIKLMRDRKPMTVETTIPERGPMVPHPGHKVIMQHKDDATA